MKSPCFQCTFLSILLPRKILAFLIEGKRWEDLATGEEVAKAYNKPQMHEPKLLFPTCERASSPFKALQFFSALTGSSSTALACSFITKRGETKTVFYHLNAVWLLVGMLKVWLMLPG